MPFRNEARTIPSRSKSQIKLAYVRHYILEESLRANLLIPSCNGDHLHKAPALWRLCRLARLNKTKCWSSLLFQTPITSFCFFSFKEMQHDGMLPHLTCGPSDLKIKDRPTIKICHSGSIPVYLSFPDQSCCF